MFSLSESPTTPLGFYKETLNEELNSLLSGYDFILEYNWEKFYELISRFYHDGYRFSLNDETYSICNSNMFQQKMNQWRTLTSIQFRLKMKNTIQNGRMHGFEEMEETLRNNFLENWRSKIAIEQDFLIKVSSRTLEIKSFSDFDFNGFFLEKFSAMRKPTMLEK